MRGKCLHRWWMVPLLAVSSLALSTSAPADPPLIEAVKNQDTTAVRALLQERADVNAPQPDGATALHWAAYHDDQATADLLIRAGANVNATNELGATPLWLACTNGSAAMIETLLTAGADPNTALPEGETPLMTASRTGIAGAVRLLLAHGADVNVTEHSRGQTALMWALAQHHHEVVRALLEHGADVHARSDSRRRLVHADSVNASQYDQGVEEDRGGFTPLLFAARHGDVDSARLLLAAGANVNDAAPTGASVLVVAAHSGHGVLAAFLLDKGADPNAAGAGYTAVHAAVLRGDLELVRTLLAHGADPNARLTKGTPVRRTSQDWALNPSFVSATPFWLAARFGEPEIMRSLAASGADPLLRTEELWKPVRARAGGVGPPEVVGGFVTPLMAAVAGDRTRGRLFLITQADSDEEERYILEAARLAVDLGGDVNAVGEASNTALHTAASRRLNTVVQLLADRGAELDVKNKAGRTPLALAIAAERRRAGRPDLDDGESTADLLRKLGATE